MFFIEGINDRLLELRADVIDQVQSDEQTSRHNEDERSCKHCNNLFGLAIFWKKSLQYFHLSLFGEMWAVDESRTPKNLLDSRAWPGLENIYFAMKSTNRFYRIN
jgi:hypothetical protein